MRLYIYGIKWFMKAGNFKVEISCFFSTVVVVAYCKTMNKKQKVGDFNKNPSMWFDCNRWVDFLITVQPKLD